MVMKISGYESRPVQVSTDKKVSTTGGDAPASSAPAAVAGSSAVRITDQAKQLANLEQVIQALPAINEGRVAEIQSAIADGRYEVNAERIAAKMLRMEHELSA